MSEPISEKIVSILQKLIVPISGVLVLVLIASGAVYFVDKSEQDKVAKSYDELFTLKKEAEKITESWEAPKDDAKVDEKSKDKKTAKKETKPQPTNEEKKQAYAKILERLMEKIKANQGNQVAVEGALVASDIGASYDDSQVGIEALQVALKGMKSSHFLFAIGEAELGNLLAKTSKCNEATQVWAKVIEVKEHAYMANNLRLKSGVCYEQMGMFDKAELLYQEIVDKSPNSASARTAKKFLLHIKYVKNKGDSDAAEKKKNG